MTRADCEALHDRARARRAAQVPSGRSYHAMRHRGTRRPVWRAWRVYEVVLAE